MKHIQYHGWITRERGGEGYKDYFRAEWTEKDGTRRIVRRSDDDSQEWRDPVPAIEFWDKKVGQPVSLLPTPLGAFRVYTEEEEVLPVTRMSHAAMLLAYSDQRHSSMTLYVSVNKNGDPLSCCGDLETIQIPVSSSDPYYQPVAIIAVPSGIPVESSRTGHTHIENLKHDIIVACQTRLQISELREVLIHTHKWPRKSVNLQVLRELLATLEGEGKMERSVKGYFQTINPGGEKK